MRSYGPYDIGEDALEHEIARIVSNAKEDLWTIFLPSYLLSLKVHIQQNDSGNRICHIKNF